MSLLDTKKILGYAQAYARSLLRTHDADTGAHPTILSAHTSNPQGHGACYATRQKTAVQSLTNNVWTAITFPAGTNAGGFQSAGGNEGRLQVPVAGLYLITAVVSFATNNVGVRDVGILKNSGGVFSGPAIIAIAGQNTETSGGNTDTGISRFVTLAAGDYVELWAAQSSGGNLNADTRTQLTVAYFSPS